MDTKHLPAQLNCLASGSGLSASSIPASIPRPPSLYAGGVPLPPARNVFLDHGHSHVPQLVNMQSSHFRIPMSLSSAATSDERSFAINVESSSGNDGRSTGGPGASFLGHATAGPNATPGGSNDEEPTVQQAAQFNVKDIIKSLEGTVPFIILAFAKIMYDHRLGILIFVAMYGTFFHANSSLRRLIAQRDVHNSLDHLGNLIWVICFLAANIIFVYYVFDDQKLYRSLYFAFPDVGEMSLWNMLWVVGTTDFIIKYSTILVKALVTAVPRQVLPFRKKGRFYLFVEIVSQFYRSLVPVGPWVLFLENDAYGGKWFSLLLLAMYIFFKGADILGRFRELKKGFYKFQNVLSYGGTPDCAQLQSYDFCPMCLDRFCDPIILSCKHIFCDECISKWFNQERTCPMCRTNIVDHPQWRDGATSSTLQLW